MGDIYKSTTLQNEVMGRLFRNSSVEQGEQKEIADKISKESEVVEDAGKTDAEKKEEQRQEAEEEERRREASKIWMYKSMPTSMLVETVQRESIAAPEHPKPTRAEAYKYAEQIVAKKIDEIT